MTTLDFLHKVQYRGRLENPRQAKQVIEIVFKILKKRIAEDSGVVYTRLSGDIGSVWKAATFHDTGRDWYTQIEKDLLSLDIRTTARDAAKAVLLTLRDAIGISSVRNFSEQLPEDLRLYVAGC